MKESSIPVIDESITYPVKINQEWSHSHINEVLNKKEGEPSFEVGEILQAVNIRIRKDRTKIITIMQPFGVIHLPLEIVDIVDDS